MIQHYILVSHQNAYDQQLQLLGLIDIPTNKRIKICIYTEMPEPFQ